MRQDGQGNEGLHQPRPDHTDNGFHFERWAGLEVVQNLTMAPRPTYPR